MLTIPIPQRGPGWCRMVRGRTSEPKPLVSWDSGERKTEIGANRARLQKREGARDRCSGRAKTVHLGLLQLQSSGGTPTTES